MTNTTNNNKYIHTYSAFVIVIFNFAHQNILFQHHFFFGPEGPNSSRGLWQQWCMRHHYCMRRAGYPMLWEVDSILTKMRHVTEVKRYGLELLYFVKRLMLLLICHRFCPLVHVVGLAQLDSEWIHWGTDWLFLLCLHTDLGMLACLLPHSQKVPISNVHPAMQGKPVFGSIRSQYPLGPKFSDPKDVKHAPPPFLGGYGRNAH